MADSALPYGLRDTRITPFTDNTTLGTLQDVPNAQTMSFSEAEEFVELRGDDHVVALRGQGASVEWEMENGGISLAAYSDMAGGTLTTSGVSPDTVTTYTKKGTDARPYFRSEGQAISDGGGDFHAVLHKCKASDSLEGELADGAFWVTSASGQSIPSTVTGDEDVLYDFIINETATPIQ